jgi:diguanylate cyclase (GGDEF)-like protein
MSGISPIRHAHTSDPFAQWKGLDILLRRCFHGVRFKYGTDFGSPKDVTSMRSLSRSLLYPVVGALLGSGVGGLVLLLRRVHADPVTLAAVCALLATIVFVVVGRIVGRREDELRESAARDALTGLANRRVFERRLAGDLREALATGRSLALLVLDVDEFKRLNDVGGHAAGDAALRMLADCLRRSCRSHDLPARFGGDEFVVLLPWTTAAEATTVAHRLRSTLAESAPHITVSIGVSDLSRCGAPRPDSLFAAADRALYLAKARGKDQVVVSSGDTAITLPIAVRQALPGWSEPPVARPSHRHARLERFRRRSLTT